MAFGRPVAINIFSPFAWAASNASMVEGEMHEVSEAELLEAMKAVSYTHLRG